MPKVTLTNVHSKSLLDHGKVTLIDHMGTDDSVASAARVSFAKRACLYTHEENHKLIRYLADHGHWTPFGHTAITFRIKAPIFVRTQLFKHKVGFVENEVSRRYVDFEPDFYVPAVFRGRPTDGAKQGSSGEISDEGRWKPLQEYANQCRASVSTYGWLVDKGVCPEQARGVLPQSMYTEWWWTGSLSAYARVYGLRAAKDAQWETQQYAQAIGDLIRPLFPVSWEALT